MHDPVTYPEPSKFIPERHLGLSPAMDPLRYVFGFGRRVCPGAHFAQVSLFINITGILTAFNITKKKDQNGVEIEPEAKWNTHTVMYVFVIGVACRSDVLTLTSERVGVSFHSLVRLHGGKTRLLFSKPSEETSGRVLCMQIYAFK
jgi:hypothetical protein